MFESCVSYNEKNHLNVSAKKTIDVSKYFYSMLLLGKQNLSKIFHMKSKCKVIIKPIMIII